MGRSPCCDKTKVKKGPWSPEEDAALKNYLEKNGTGGSWIALPRKAGLKRCGKSCRLRWLNYLRPDIKHGGFTEEEDNIIFSLYCKLGSRWSIIAAHLQGRTDNDVKNHWNTKLKKKLLAAGSSEATTPPMAFPSTAEVYTSPWLNQTSMTIPSLPTSTYGLDANTQSLNVPQPHHYSLPGLAEASEFGASMVRYSSPASQDSAVLNTNTQSLILPQLPHYSLPELAQAREFGTSLVSYSSPASQDSAGFSDYCQDSSFMPFSSNGSNGDGFFVGFGNGLPCEDFNGIWSQEMVGEVGGSCADLASFCLADTKMQGRSRRDEC